ncbi:MAG: amidohydrolase family protein [Rectinemataceae bacterium]|jgi:5-methylthioadenosine/S-adenosylhomocysteine deaminase
MIETIKLMKNMIDKIIPLSNTVSTRGFGLSGRTIIHDILCLTMNAKRQMGVVSIVIEGNVIAEVCEGSLRSLQANRHIEGAGKVALPGLINAHVHGDIFLARGLGDGIDLHTQGGESFIGRNRWFRKDLVSGLRQLSRKAQYAEALRGGTTYLCDFLFWLDEGDDLVSPFSETGLQGAIAFDYRKDFLASELRSEEEISRIMDALDAGGIRPILQGPSEEFFEPELLSYLRSTSDALGLQIHLHLAETVTRKRIVIEKFGISSVKFLKKQGFLSDRFVGSHGVYLDVEDIDILAAEGVSIVSSPTAEMKIADGIAPVTELLEHGVKVGLGSDGALWNDSSDMFEEMKNLMLVQRVFNGASSFSAYDALYAATMGGACALGVENIYGSIEKGKRASIAIIDVMRPNIVPIYHGARSNVVQNIVSCVKAQDVDIVFVDGEIVVEGGRLLRFDDAALTRAVQEEGTRLFQTHP